MQKIKNKRVKFILLFPFDLINTFIGIIYFKLFQNTKNFFYQSMVRLFCITGGSSNKLINDLTSKKKISNKINLNSDTTETVKSLKKNGYSIEENFLSENECNSILKFCTDSKLDIRPSENENWENDLISIDFDFNNFKAVMYELPKNKVLMNKKICNIIFSKKILSICQEYFDSEPIFDHASLSISTSYSKSPDSKAAQLFHFDLDRPKWLKFLIYITDVSFENGPHVFVEGTHKDKGIEKSLLSRGYERLNDEIIKEIYNDSVKTFNKKKGTLIVEDTRGLHKGDIVKSGYRCLLNIQFNSSNYGTKIVKQVIPEENINKEFFNNNRYIYQNLELSKKNEI